jgi:SAM-dependent methyltransferase
MLSDNHPEIERSFLDFYSESQSRGEARIAQLNFAIEGARRICNLPADSEVAVIGCGPVPLTIKEFASRGYRVTGFEPLPQYVEHANSYLKGCGAVTKGVCENLPVADEVFDLVFLESVLEHVDSPAKSLNEIYRVLKPGGLLYLTTVLKHRFSLTGRNPEYTKSFYNWFPDAVKEGYISSHLSKNPRLANYSPLPAVHWYTYTSLCKLGRDAGFGKFFSLVDVMDNSDERLRQSRLFKVLLYWAKHNPWLKAILLSQIGHTIYMFKRRSF